jgi:hypothetical protein
MFLAFPPPQISPPSIDRWFRVFVLLPWFGSGVLELTFAVFVMVLPGGNVSCTTNVTVNSEPFATVPAEQLTVPVPPTGGAEHDPTVVDTL